MKEREKKLIKTIDDSEVAYILGYLDGIVDKREMNSGVLDKAGKMVKEYLEKRAERVGE